MLRHPVLLGMATCLAAGTAFSRAAGPEDSVVRVQAVLRLPNPIRPWVRQNPIQTEGSGVVIDGPRILTNAHQIPYATQITVQGRLGGRRYDAEVEAISHDIDLALLRVDDPTFFENHPPIRRAERLPRIADAVTVYGYPQGGAGMAVTRGAVTRIDYAPITEATPGLVIQVDAAIQPGNSGGPALVDGVMVGLVYAQEEAIGHILSNREIDLFVEDAGDGRYDGKPLFDYGIQTLENEALRARFGVAADVQGVLVTKLAEETGEGPLREFDVLTAIGPERIDNEGMIQTPEGLRVSFWYGLERLARDGQVPFRVLRDGNEREILVPTPTVIPSLVRSYDGEQPPYFVVGPLVFSPLYDEAISYYLQLNPMAILNRGPIFTRRTDDPRFPGEELVVVTSPMLQHRSARGYDEPLGLVLERVNEIPIRNLRHLVETIRDCRDEFLTFRFAGEFGATQVYRREEMLAATEGLLAENGIPRSCSPDLMEIWVANTP